MIDIGDWKVETLHGCFASRSRRGEEIEVDADADGLNIRVEEGHGYHRASTSAHVPIDVLTMLLGAAGYLVTPRAKETSK